MQVSDVVGQCDVQIRKKHTSIERTASQAVIARIPDGSLTQPSHQSGIY